MQMVAFYSSGNIISSGLHLTQSYAGQLLFRCGTSIYYPIYFCIIEDLKHVRLTWPLITTDWVLQSTQRILIGRQTDLDIVITDTTETRFKSLHPSSPTFH